MHLYNRLLDSAYRHLAGYDGVWINQCFHKDKNLKLDMQLIF